MKSYPRQLLATIVKNAAQAAIEKGDQMYGRQLASVLERHAKDLRIKFGRRELGLFWCVPCKRSSYRKNESEACLLCGGILVYADNYAQAKVEYESERANPVQPTPPPPRMIQRQYDGKSFTPEALHEKVRELRAEGIPYNRIAITIGIPAPTILGIFTILDEKDKLTNEC